MMMRVEYGIELKITSLDAFENIGLELVEDGITRVSLSSSSSSDGGSDSSDGSVSVLIVTVVVKILYIK